MDGILATADQATGLEAVYRAEADRLWHALLAYGGDAELASDALAEAYAQALRRGSAIRDPGAWTWRAAFRIASGALQARRVAEQRQRPTPADEGRAGDVAAMTDRYADPDLAAALRQLPDAQRAAVVLFYFLDLPIAEIAARLGSNRLAVRANLSRGRRRLRQLLGDDDG
jgi:RNA polymerase sigma-70 factor (ECF subfamily)